MAVIRGERVEEKGVYTSEGKWVVPKSESLGEFLQFEHEKAFQEGVKQGEREGAVWITLLEDIGEKLLEYKHELLEKIKPELIEFSLRVCERVLRNELADPENLMRLLHSLFTAAFPLLEEDQLLLFLAPDDLSRVEKFFTEEARWKKIRLRSDPMMQVGDIRIETKTRMCRYDLSRELALIQQNVLKQVSHVSTSSRA